MYEGPINMICGELQMHLEGETLKAVQNVGVDVNKEELIKALNYDRNQYGKGYKDGYADAIDEFVNALINYQSQDEEYKSFSDVCYEIAERLKGGVE